ncbi:hypothetical protein [Neisseria dentiae]|uniref:SCO4402 family protein n=1 Tax=Neisseria dentiae TaxID=194197 RepID=UPI0035A02F37
MELSKLTLPNMRKELISYVDSLSDIDYQERVWVQKNFPSSNFYDDFDESIHFFYDDTSLSEDPFEYIGSILLNNQEAEAVSSLISALDDIFSKYGLHLSDKEYIELTEWIHVINAAKKLKLILFKNQKS